MTLTPELKEIALRVAKTSHVACPCGMQSESTFVEFAERFLAAMPKPEPVAYSPSYGLLDWYEGGYHDCSAGTLLYAEPPIHKPASEQKPITQFRKVDCSDWYDGLPDHEDGRGPYETRTLYTTPPAPDDKVKVLVEALEDAEYTLTGFSTDNWSDDLLKKVKIALAAVKEQ